MKKHLWYLSLILILIMLMTGNTYSYFNSSSKAETIVLSPTSEPNVVDINILTDSPYFEYESISLDVVFSDAESRQGLMSYEMGAVASGTTVSESTTSEGIDIDDDFYKVYDSTTSEAITFVDMDGMGAGEYTVFFIGHDLDGWTVYKSTVKISVIEQPVETSTITEVLSEEAIVDEQAVEEAPVEEPVTEEPVVEDPAAEETLATETPVEEAEVDEVSAEEPSADGEPVTETVVEEEPAEEAPVEEPVTEESAVEDPSADGTPAEEPASEEATNEEETSD